MQEMKILVVDDNYDAVNALCDLLEVWGYETNRAYDGATVINMIKNYQPNVLLLDIGLPIMNGFEVAKKIKDDPLYKDLKIYAVTGYGAEEDIRKSNECGFNGYFVKPVNLDQLKITLNDLNV